MPAEGVRMSPRRACYCLSQFRATGRTAVDGPLRAIPTLAAAALLASRRRRSLPRLRRPLRPARDPGTAAGIQLSGATPPTGTEPGTASCRPRRITSASMPASRSTTGRVDDVDPEPTERRRTHRVRGRALLTDTVERLRRRGTHPDRRDARGRRDADGHSARSTGRAATQSGTPARRSSTRPRRPRSTRRSAWTPRGRTLQNEGTIDWLRARSCSGTPGR